MTLYILATITTWLILAAFAAILRRGNVAEAYHPRLQAAAKAARKAITPTND